MNQQIPDELGREIARVAAGLNLDVESAVREALESWLRRVGKSSGQRLPDAPLLDDAEMDLPCEFPRSFGRSIRCTPSEQRVPDGVGLG
jgi:hypothetical protein